MTATVLISVLLGGLAQRATGMGLVLVSAPFIVVALGPAAGVLIGNLLGVLANVLVLARTHRAVEWRALWAMLPPGIVGVGAGTLLAEQLPTAWAQIIIGALVLVALLVSALVARARHLERGPVLTAGAGAASGAMAALAGIGGPAMAVLRTLTRWDHASFAATLQPFFIGTSSVAVFARVTVDPGAWPDLGWGWLAIALAMVLGVAFGDVVARRLPARVIGAGITAVAALGAVWSVLDGLTAL
ncbi:sulfite exporter TauE/SafE family protein [Georgenia thermotolerans]|uniref:Probable membrane transporter protein n=1 Tax=Georgenia thermotolerans TaxID=527326 RepID=A0A7J5UTM0_9MICO|nr:sulfite exporter TauE/SafE family protein [Georgenia thermotolerans]KAE8765623.1 TSUP family transporter [Georgenia thermotolerans]